MEKERHIAKLWWRKRSMIGGIDLHHMRRNKDMYTAVERDSIAKLVAEQAIQTVHVHSDCF